MIEGYEQILELLLGIDRSPGTAVADEPGSSSPRCRAGRAPSSLIAGGDSASGRCFWRLYVWERRELSRGKRALLVGLRALTLLALAAMLVEPVLVSIRRETVPSHLPIVLDDSESMRFSDPYTDESRAVATRRRLEAGVRAAGGRRSSGCGRRRGSTWSRRSSARDLSRWAAGRKLFVYDLESAVAGQARGRRRRRARLDDVQAESAGLARWAMRCTGCWRRIAASRSPA